MNIDYISKAGNTVVDIIGKVLPPWNAKSSRQENDNKVDKELHEIIAIVLLL